MSDHEATSLERALIGKLLTVLMWIERLPDDEIDPDTAVRIEEYIAAAVQGLDGDDRSRFVRIASSLAAEADASRPATGETLRAALDAIGLPDRS